MTRLREIARLYVEHVRDHDIPGLGAELAFRFLFAIFPFGIFVAALAALVASMVGIENPAGRVVSGLGDNLPRELAGPVQAQLQAVIDQTRPTLLSLGAVAALYAASGGTNVLIKAMNRAFDVAETRAVLPRVARAVGLTLLGSVAVLSSFVTIVGGTLLTQRVVETLGLTSSWGVISLVRWPLVFAILTVGVALVFRLAPNVVPSWRWALIGAAVFAVAWLVATLALALYVAGFANYASTYGALGAVIILMLWFYVTSIVLVAAAEFVAVMTKVTEPERLQARRAELAMLEDAEAEARTAVAGAADGVRDAADGVRGETARREAPTDASAPSPARPTVRGGRRDRASEPVSSRSGGDDRIRTGE